MKRLLLVLLMCAPVWAANNFIGDPNCVAWYRFEPGALETDSSTNGNTLTNSGVDSNTVDVREGAGSAVFLKANDDYMTRADGSLSANFPGKNGTSNTTFSVCFWFKMKTLPVGGSPDWAFQRIVGKLESSHYSWACGTHLSSSPVVGAVQGMNISLTPTTANTVDNTTRLLSVDVWYHAAYTYEGVGGNWHVRLYDTSNSTIYDRTGVDVALMVVETSALWLGRRSTAMEEYNGVLDEAVIFNDVLTTEEIDDIRGEIFGSGGNNDWSWRRRHNN